MNGDTIRTITIRGQSEGLDKLTADVNKLAAAQQNVAIVSEQSAKRVLSLEDAWKRQTLRLDEAARAQANIARETKIADAALREGLATQAQHAQRLDQINQRYVTTATVTKNVAQQTGLARHEMVNLSRQVQDVGVSLASGQSPFMVAIQQGSQIADVFANSTGTLKGFFGQAVAGAGRFIGSFAGAATIVAGLGASIVYVANQYGSAQRDIERALAGIGAASGVTRGQLNKIASDSATALGLSTSQAREAATSFAATGRVSGENIAKATAMVKDYARATGIDAAEATKRLAEAMLDPSKGALELDRNLGALDATTINYIRSLQAQGREQEAIAVMLDKLNPKIQKQAEYVSGLPLLWDLATNALSNWYGMVGKIAMQGPLPALTPPDSGDGGQTRLNQMSKDADEAALKINGLTGQITAMQTELSKLSKYREAISGPMTAAETVGNVRLQQLIEQNDALQRQAKYLQDLAALYPGITIETAKQLEIQNAQLAVAQARTQAERDVAQQQLEQVKLLMQGVGLEETLTRQAGDRAIKEEQARKAGGRYYSQNNTDATNAANAANDVADATEGAAKATKEYGAAATDSYDNAALAAEEAAKAQLAANQAVGLGTDGMHHYGWEVARVTTQVYQLVDAFEAEQAAFHNMSMAFQIDNRLRDMGTQFQGETGEYSYDRMNIQARKAALEAQVGAGNVEGYWVGTGIEKFYNYRISQSYLDQLKADQQAASIEGLNVSSPSAIQASLQQVLSMGDTGAANRLIDYAEPSQQGSLIQQTIDYIRQTQPAGLAREEMINTLNDKLEQLANSTDSLNATMQNALSPFYSQDPRTTKLGFRAGVTGNPDWMTGATNANPLVAVLGSGATAPGMANGGSFTVGGGYSANDNKLAVFPVASGEEIVVNRNKGGGGGGGQVVHIDNRIIITGSVDADALSQMKVSRYQQAQRMRGQLA